jgi:hypothetical protein
MTILELIDKLKALADLHPQREVAGVYLDATFNPTKGETVVIDIPAHCKSDAGAFPYVEVALYVPQQTQ